MKVDRDSLEGIRLLVGVRLGVKMTELSESKNRSSNARLRTLMKGSRTSDGFQDGGKTVDVSREGAG